MAGDGGHCDRASTRRLKASGEPGVNRHLGVGVTGYLKGMPVPIATESARRMIPPRVRPSMKEMEEALKAAKESPNG